MRIEQLTFLRFLAAAVVVVFHYGVEATGLSGFLTAGPQMVTFFFVLSGFVMTVAYGNRKVGAGAFWAARAAKILPVYFISLALILIAFKLSKTEIHSKALLLNIFLLQSWIHPHATSLNTPAWSLSVEAFFYFTFPFILILIRRFSLSVGKMLFIAIMLWVITQTVTTVVLSYGFYKGLYSASHSFIYYFPIPHFCSFLLGLAGGMVFIANKDRESGKKDDFFFLLLAAASLAALVVMMNNETAVAKFFKLNFAFCSSFYAPLCTLLITALSLCRSKVLQVLQIKPLVLLGNASYSLYMLQKPVHAAFLKFFTWNVKIPPLYDFLLYFAILIAVSIASFLLFEHPLNLFLRRTLFRADSGRQ